MWTLNTDMAMIIPLCNIILINNLFCESLISQIYFFYPFKYKHFIKCFKILQKHWFWRSLASVVFRRYDVVLWFIPTDLSVFEQSFQLFSRNRTNIPKGCSKCVGVFFRWTFYGSGKLWLCISNVILNVLKTKWKLDFNVFYSLLNSRA